MRSVEPYRNFPSTDPNKKLTPQELRLKLHNIILGEIPEAYRDEKNVACLRKRSKQWIKQMCYVAAKSNVDTQPFIDRLKHIFGDKEISCLEAAVEKSVQRANVVSEIKKKELLDDQSEYLYEMTNHMRLSDVPGLLTGEHGNILKVLSPLSVSWLQQQLRLMLVKNLPCVNSFMLKIMDMFRDELAKVFSTPYCQEIASYLRYYKFKGDLVEKMMEKNVQFSQQRNSGKSQQQQQSSFETDHSGSKIVSNVQHGGEFSQERPVLLTDPGAPVEEPKNDLSSFDLGSLARKMGHIELESIPGLGATATDPKPKITEECLGWLRKTCFFMAQQSMDMEPFISRLKQLLDKDDMNQFLTELWKIVDRADQTKATRSTEVNRFPPRTTLMTTPSEPKELYTSFETSNRSFHDPAINSSQEYNVGASRFSKPASKPVVYATRLTGKRRAGVGDFEYNMQPKFGSSMTPPGMYGGYFSPQQSQFDGVPPSFPTPLSGYGYNQPVFITHARMMAEMRKGKMRKK